MSVREIWIGLVDFVVVGSDHPLLPESKGAVVNALVYTNSKDDFLHQICGWAIENSLELVYSEDIEPFTARVASTSVDEVLYEAAQAVSEASPIAFGVFQNYETDIE